MFRRTLQIGMLVVLVALVASASSQTEHCTIPAASVGDDFAAYRHALDRAADLALENVEREAVMNSQSADASTKTAVLPDATTLHQFAEQYWNGNDEAVRRAIARVMQLRPILTPILREEGVPDEVAALVLIESAGQGTALSP